MGCRIAIRSWRSDLRFEGVAGTSVAGVSAPRREGRTRGAGVAMGCCGPSQTFEISSMLVFILSI
jgi:hypothetical protein